MKRKRYYISDDLKISEKKKRAAEVIEVLTKQLSQGWNPWVNVNESRGFVLFELCLQRYLNYVERMNRAKTRQSYRSRVNILKEYHYCPRKSVNILGNLHILNSLTTV